MNHTGDLVNHRGDLVASAFRRKTIFRLKPEATRLAIGKERFHSKEQAERSKR